MIGVSVRKKSVFGAMLLILACTLFAPVTAHAETNEISIQSVTLSSTEGNAEEINPATTDGQKISLDIKLYDPGDSVTYTVGIKNNTDSNFYIDDESAKTTTDYLEYVFDYGNTRAIAAGQSRSINLVVAYKNKVPADQLENDQRVELDSLSLNFFEEGEILVPNTIDITLVVYSAAVIISAAVLYKLFKAKKIFICLILAMACVAAVAPAKANAVRECSIDVEARVTIDGKEAYFLTGSEADVKMKEVAGTDTSVDGRRTLDTNILAIKKSDAEPLLENKTANHIVSTNESPYPIYVWFDNGDLFWWSEDKTPNLNEDASYMFRSMVGMLDISGVADFDSSNTVDMSTMFGGPATNPMNITSVKPLANWNTSKVTNMQALFQSADKITTLEGLEKWDVSNVETLYLTFGYMTGLTSIEALRNWDISKVVNMRLTFVDTVSLGSLNGLEDWDTSMVEDMNFTFGLDSKVDYTKAKLSNIDALANWNVSKVTTINTFFQKQAAITSLDALKKWDVSNVTDFTNFCSHCISLSDARAANNWDMASVTIFDWMFNDTPALKEINLSNFNFSQVATTSDANLISNNPNLERLKTPKIYPTDSAVKIKLPVTMYDADGNAYTQLDNTSPAEIWLTSTAP